MLQGSIAAGGLFGEHRRHLPFIAAALVLALAGGLLLAVGLTLEAAARPAVGARWIAIAQVHGHLQAIGFVGLFIAGVTYHLLPGLAGRPLAHATFVPLSFWLLVGGVVARAVGQPLLDHEVASAAVVIGAWMESVGAGLFTLVVWSTALPALAAGRAFLVFLLAGSAWCSAQALAGGWWLADVVVGDGLILPAHRDGALVSAQLLGFHLSFIAGVALRTFPVFFAAPRPGARAVLLACVAVQGGTAAVIAGRLWDGAAAWAVADAGYVTLAGGVILTAWLTGAWRSPSRVRAGARPFARTLQAGAAWLVVAAALMAGAAIAAALHERAVPQPRVDAIHHLVGIGAVLSTIVGMAQLILPEFATERVLGRQAAWRAVALGGGLSVAAALRGGAAWFAATLPGRSEYVLMSIAGVIGLTVMAVFASLVARSVRRHGAALAQIAVAAQSGERAPR